MIPIAKPFLGDKEAAAASDVILSGWVTQGPKVNNFEKSFCEFTGANFCCAVSSCTAALHLALLAVGVKPGDLVITVSHSFIATANAIRHCGAEPVFIDIDPKSFNMSPEHLTHFLENDCSFQNGIPFYKDAERLVVGESPLKFSQGAKSFGKIAALLPVHQMGIPFDVRKIIEIARTHNLPIVEDAACAIGSEISRNGGKSWEKIGKPHGDIACFSFHPRKILTTGDGGMLTTNNPDFDKKFRLLRQHGMSTPDFARHGSSKVIIEEYLTTGHNYRMTDIQAAVGIEQLTRLPDIVAERRHLAEIYYEQFKSVEEIRLLQQDDGLAKLNWQSFPVLFPGLKGFDQLKFMQKLQDMRIASRPGIMNSHKEPPYSAQKWHLPHSEFCRNRTILLPLFNGLRKKEIKMISAAVREIIITMKG